MFELRISDPFKDWFDRLSDPRAQARIAIRLKRMEAGNLGDVKSVGDRVFEARIDYGPGYRVYFVRQTNVLIVLLCGGSKKTQSSDIRAAQKMAKGL
jgi:putative addiction module killer protein